MDLANEYNDDELTDAEYVPDKEDTEQDTIRRREHERSSMVWQHCKIVSKNACVAKCNYCGKDLSYRTTVSNLKKHLLSKHKRVFEQEHDDNRLVKSNSTSPIPVDLQDTIRRRKYKRSSIVWQHCTILSKSKCLARCNYCGQDLSYRTTVSNLKKHLVAKHKRVLEEAEQDDEHEFQTNSNSPIYSADSESDTKTTEKSNNTRRSKTWKYFNTYDENSKLANCKICNKDVTFHTVSQLQFHIGKYHGTIDVGGVASSDGDNDARVQEELKQSSSRMSSKSWQYFNLKDSINKIATCKYCEKDLSYNFVGNLMKHVIRAHSKVLTSFSSDEEGMVPVSVKRDPEYTKVINTKRKTSSQAWKYFSIKDPVKKIATCKFCKKEFVYQTISNLKKHMMRTHSKMLASCSSDDEEKVKSAPFTSKCKPQRKFRSAAWKYFDVENPETKVAKCRLCDNNFSFSCITNLRKHLKRKHEGMLLDEEAFTDEEGEAEVELDDNSPVWAYFKCLDDVLKIASCLICKKRVEYNDEHDLNRHMNRKHPGVDFVMKNKPKKLMITGNGDIFEIDDNVAKQEPVTSQEDDNDSSNSWLNHNDEVNALHSTEYLDEDVFEEPKHVSPQKKRHKFTPKCQNKRYSNVQRTAEDENTIEMFGKYLVSLLKALPKHKSDKLQVDFIKQVMEVQLTNENIRRKSIYRPKPSGTQNTHHGSHSTNNDDARVTSNSEVQEVISTDGESQDLAPSKEELIVVTSVGENGSG